MVNLDSYINNRRIKSIYRIINEPIENWNAIGKYWLSRLDFKFNDEENIKGLFWKVILQFPNNLTCKIIVHIVQILSMLGLIFDKTRDTCLNLRMKHLSICK
jgi:hypothetical protein